MDEKIALLTQAIDAIGVANGAMAKLCGPDEAEGATVNVADNAWRLASRALGQLIDERDRLAILAEREAHVWADDQF